MAFRCGEGKGSPLPSGNGFDQLINNNATKMLAQGRQTFRFDTFGDEKFWGDTLLLHPAIEGKPEVAPYFSIIR